MWLRAHFTMTLRKRHPDDVSGAHRAILELAVAMQDELDIHDIDPSGLREKDLKERVDKELGGGAISYAYSKAELQTYSFRRGLSGWFKREKWWFAAIVVSSALITVVATLTENGLWFGLWSMGIWCGQVSAFCMGTTNGSRALIMLCFCVITTIIIISCATSITFYE
jgi:hypothetical protein